MLQKIKEFSDKSQNIYRNLITGQEGTISQIGTTGFASDRNEKRHKRRIPKVKSNRASNKGRHIYYQLIYKMEQVFDRFNNVRDGWTGKIIKVERLTKEVPVLKKTIKHVQESYSAIQRKYALLNLYDRIENNKRKWHNDHPEYKSKTK